MRIIFVTIIFCLLFVSCLKDEPFKNEYTGFKPAATSDEWEISTPELEGVDSKKLEQAYRLLYSDQRFLMARSMIIARNGKMIAEAYPHDISDRSTQIFNPVPKPLLQ